MSAAQLIGKVSPIGQLDSSISFGHIYNISDSSDRSKGTDEFLTGEALTGTLMLPKIPIGIAATMSTDNLKSNLGNISKKPIGGEIVTSSGKGASFLGKREEGMVSFNRYENQLSELNGILK